MHGAFGRDLNEIFSMRAARGNQTPSPFIIGVLKSYNLVDNTVDVNFPHVDPTFTQSTRMPLMTPWVGAGYGDQGGPEVGIQVVVASVGTDSDDYIALGFLYTANQTPPGTPAKERWIVDDNGSSFKLTQNGKGASDGMGAAKVAGAQYASVTSGGLLELGAENLTAGTNNVVRQTDLQSAINNAISVVQTALRQLAAIVQSGGGVTAPIVAGVTATASSDVLAE